MIDKNLPMFTLLTITVAAAVLANSYHLDQEAFHSDPDQEADVDTDPNDVDRPPSWRQGTDAAFGKLPLEDDPPELTFEKRELEPAWRQGTDAAFGKLPLEDDPPELTFEKRELEPAWRKGTDSAFGKLPLGEKPFDSDVDKRELEPFWRKGTDAAFGKMPNSGPEVIRQKRIEFEANDVSEEPVLGQDILRMERADPFN